MLDGIATTGLTAKVLVEYIEELTLPVASTFVRFSALLADGDVSRMKIKNFLYFSNKKCNNRYNILRKNHTDIC